MTIVKPDSSSLVYKTYETATTNAAKPLNTMLRLQASIA